MKDYSRSQRSKVFSSHWINTPALHTAPLTNARKEAGCSSGTPAASLRPVPAIVAAFAIPVTVPTSPVKPEIESQELPKPSGDEWLISRSRGLLCTLLFHCCHDTCFSRLPLPTAALGRCQLRPLLGFRVNQRRQGQQRLETCSWSSVDL